MSVIYRDGPHTYEDTDTKVPYMSGTRFLELFDAEKDWEVIRENFAKKHNKKVKNETGVDPKTDSEYWKEEWKRLGDEACVKGTKYHLEQENLVLNGELYSEETVHPAIEGEGDIKYSFDTLTLEEGVYPELIVWSNKARVAGQADLVIVKDGFVHVSDYKTNKKIDIAPYVRWDGTFDRKKQPISHVPCTKGEGYFLQLNLYMNFILKHNPTLQKGKMTINHAILDENGKAIETIDIDVPDYQDEIEKLVEWRSEELMFA